MPTYVYRCPKGHIQAVTHKMSECDTIVVLCLTCGKTMKRKPQRFRFGFSSDEILQEWMDENYRRWRTKRQRFSPDLVKRPGKPLPGILSETRTKK